MLKFTRRGLIGTAMAVAMVAGSALLGSSADAQDKRSYLLTTASTGGTYYPVGVAIATLVKVKLEPGQNIAMSAINSAGSGENVKLLREDQAQFGILQGLWGSYAWEGSGPLANDGKQDEMRSVSMLWSNVEHFIVASEHADTGTVADLDGIKGMGFGIGRRNSGTEGSNTALLSGLGINPAEDYELFHAGYNGTADALLNGNIAGMNTPAGVPVGAVTRAFASGGDSITLLNVTPEQRMAADGGRELWTEYHIPAGTYPGLDTDVTTIAQPNFLAVRADIPEEDVYLITKTMYENLGFLNNIHAATKAMSLERAIAGLPVPLHPGAARYYQEMGLSLPARLIVE